MSESLTRLRLPNRLAAKAHDLASGELMPVPPRDSATVVLLRERPGGAGAGIEAYMLRRAPSMKFAPGAYVFPGGSVDQRDADRQVGWSGPAPADWAARLDVDEPLARALVCAAVRETFEESGVLLAGPTAGSVVEDTRGEEWEADRQSLLDRSLSLAELLQRRGLLLRSDLLRPWAHWITPEFEPRRFSTRFFVAELPAGQRARDISGEADHVVWEPPRRALEAYERGELTIMPPTAVTLLELASHDTVEGVLGEGDERDVNSRLPKMIVDEAGEVHLVLPDDPEYPNE